MPPRARRWLRTALLCLAGLGAALVLGVALLLAAIDSGAGRARVMSFVNTALAGTFRGRLSIVGLDHLSLNGASGVSAELHDSEGRRVATAHDATIRVNVIGLARGLLLAGPVLSLRIDEIAIERAEVDLTENDAGVLRIVDAVDTRDARDSLSPSAEDDTSDDSLAPRILLDSIQIKHASLSGLGHPTLDRATASVSNVEASLDVAPPLVEVEVRQAEIDGRDLLKFAATRGRLQGVVRVVIQEEPLEPHVLVQATFEGHVDELPVRASVDYAEPRWAAELEIQRAPPQALRRWAPALALEQPVDVQASLAGTLGRALIDVDAAFGESRVVARGTLSLDPEFSTELDVSMQHVDAHALLPEAPATSLNLRSHVTLAVDGATLEAKANVSTDRSTLRGSPLPDTQWVLRLGPETLDGRGQIQVRGAPTRVHFELSGLGAPGGVSALVFDVESDLVDYAALSRTMPAFPAFTGTGTATTRGVVNLAARAPTIDAVLYASIGNFSFAGAGAQRLELRGTASGPLSSPAIALAANATQVLAPGGIALPELRATATGRFPDVKVGLVIPNGGVHVPELVLSAQLNVDAERLSDVKLALRRESVALQVSGRSFEWANGRFVLSGLEVRGAGELDANVRVGHEQTRVEATARQLDLGALTRLFGIRDDARGVASFEAEIDIRRGRPSGKLSGELRDVTFDDIDGGQMSTTLALHDGALAGQLTARLGQIAELTLRANDFELPPVWSITALRGGSGALDVEASAELDQLSALGVLSGRLAPATGRVTASAQITRHPGELATLNAKLTTDGFGWQASAESPGSAAVRRWPGIWRDVELEALLELNRKRELNLELLLVDARGALAKVKGRCELSQVDLQSLSLLDVVRLPFELEMDIPRRALKALPTPLRPPRIDGVGAGGEVAAKLVAKGPLGELTLDAHLDLTHLQLGAASRQQGAKLQTEPLSGPAATLNLQSRVRYERGVLTLSSLAESAGASVLELQGEAALDVERLIRTPRARQALDAKLNVDITHFPLRALTFMGDRSIDGILDGNISLSSTGDGPDARVQLSVSPLTVGELPAQALTLDASIHGGRLAGKAELIQPRGRAQVAVDAGMIWNGFALPRLDPAQGVQATIVARDFRLTVLRTLLPEAHEELDGVLSGDLYVNSTSQSLVTGNASVREGVFQVPALGQEFRDIRGRADFDRDGLVRVTDVSARAVAGRLRLDGQAKLDGLELRSARATVDVSKGDRIPVTLEGVPVGTAWGHVELTLARSKSDISLLLKVPRLHVDLPAVAPNTVQPLDMDSTISTGTYVDSGRFVPWKVYPEKQDAIGGGLGLPIEVDIELGNDVWIHRGSTFEARLTGKIKAPLAKDLSLAGTLSIPDGQVDVQGRLFEIQDSTVTFLPDEEPSNPVVVATARWAGAEGYEVFADFVGPVETGKLSLRSEPPLDDDQIFSLLLFGSPEGQFGATADAEAEAGTATALGVSGGMIVQGLNRQLQELTSLDIRTRIDQSNGSPQPEVALQISPRVTAELSYDLATPSPGESPDTTFLTLDLRLLRNWSLSTTLGNQGSTFIDMFWRYRY